MCCLAKCLLGYVFGWAIFALNLAAAGALLAGAFAPWATYSATTSGVTLTMYAAGLGVAGTSSSSSISVPTGITMAQVSSALVAATGASSSVGWTSASVNTVYVGMAGQVAAAASILAYMLISSILCLCTLCCCCCPQSHVCNALIAAAKLGVALVGVASMGSFFLAFDTALKATAASDAAYSAAVNANSVMLPLLATAGSTPAVGPGKGLGSLGVALLAAVVVLHILQAIQCGGAHHHPEKPKAADKNRGPHAQVAMRGV